MLSVSNLETDRLRYELQKFLPQDAPTNFGPTNRLLQAYYAFRDGPTELTAKEIAVAEKAYNDARSYQAPQEVPPGFSTPARAAQTPVTLDEAIQKAKADAVAAQLSGTPRVVGADARGNTRTVQKGSRVPESRSGRCLMPGAIVLLPRNMLWLPDMAWMIRCLSRENLLLRQQRERQEHRPTSQL